MDFAFNNLEQSDVISLIRPENLASIKVAEKLWEKLEKESEVLGNKALVYGINRKEWEKNL